MKFALTIDCDGAAFDDDTELSTILRKLSKKLDETLIKDLSPGIVLDTNGNAVGKYDRLG